MIYLPFEDKKNSSKKVGPLDDNLDEYFGLSQSQNSQVTADVTPIDTSKKSEEANMKNDPDGSSHRRGRQVTQAFLKVKTTCTGPAVSSHRKLHKSPQGSAGEGSSELPSKLKQYAQQTMKPESEDSSSFSSLSSGSESLDEEVPSKGKMKELPPTSTTQEERQISIPTPF